MDRFSLRGRLLPILLLLSCLPLASALAFSSGSTVCEVNSLPFAPMAGVLRDPAPAGWRVSSDADHWYPGAIRQLRIQHPDPTRRVRGVLLWVKGSPFGMPSGAGAFIGMGVDERYQFVNASPPGQCGEWAVTHRDASAKPQADLLFAWQAPLDPGIGSLIVRAFLIEDCADAPGVCRDAQALTAFLPLREVLFAAGFE